MDILAPFLAEKCVTHPAAKIEAKELYKEYKDWCYENDDVELKNRAFYRQLEIRGFKKAKGAKNKTFIHGITLNQYWVCRTAYSIASKRDSIASSDIGSPEKLSPSAFFKSFFICSIRFAMSF